jgi:ArsR family transcriptional regulator
MREFLKITKALSDKTRVRVFKMLQQKTMCVCEVQAVLGIAQSTTSKHLQILEDAGLVKRTKEGLWVNYDIDEDSRNPFAGPIIEDLTGMFNDDPEVEADIEKAKRANRFELCPK